MSTANTAATIAVELVVGQETLALHNALNHVLHGVSVWTEAADKDDGEALFDRLAGLWKGQQQDARLTVAVTPRELSLAVAALKWVVDNTGDSECHTLTGVQRSDVDALRSRLQAAQ
jgi:hypothetical protein